jgi:Family of unknown function (DUF6535)
MDLRLLEWTGPDKTDVAIMALLHASLSATLLAAFIAMLGKQWINMYAQQKRGSLAEQCRDRQHKLDGIEKWKFHVILEVLPLMLQLALLFLGIALSQYMWGISKTVAVVIIGVTSFGVLFYALVVVSATVFYYCPFQTPASILLRRLMICISGSPLWLNSGARFHLKSISKFVSSRMTKAKRGLMKQFVPSSALDSTHLPDNESVVDHVEEPAPLFDDQHVGSPDNVAENKLDARCVMWMRDASTDPDVSLTVMEFIPEVE